MRDESPGEFQNRPFRAFSEEYVLPRSGPGWGASNLPSAGDLVYAGGRVGDAVGAFPSEEREARTDRNVRLAEENLCEERVREIVREELKVMLGRGVRVGESRVSVGEIVDEMSRRERLEPEPRGMDWTVVDHGQFDRAWRRWGRDVRSWLRANP